MASRSRALPSICVVAVCLSFSLPSLGRAAPINFRFNFTDAPGSGFLDPVFGGSARAALFSAGIIWGQSLQASYVGETIGVDVNFGALPADLAGVGGSTVERFNFTNSLPDTQYTAALTNHLLGRDTLLPGNRFGVTTNNEIMITFNNTASFSFGESGMLGSGQYDFLTTALHEIGHGLGFETLIASDGSYARNEIPLPTLYDRFVVDQSGTALTDLTDAERLAAATTPGGILWSGADAIAANGGVMPRLSASTTYVPATSVLHFSGSAFDAQGRSDILMVPSIRGRSIRAPDAVTLGVLADLGWDITPVQVAAVPEPGTMAMVGVGLVGVAAATWRTRKQIEPADSDCDLQRVG